MTLNLPYRPGVGVLLLNSGGEVFAGRRIDTVEPAWQMPQGGIDADEAPAVAARRELREEAGTDRFRILAESPDWFTYDLPPSLMGNVWGGRFRGQRQKWFACRFLGTDADIDLDAHDPEFSEWRWVRPADLPSLIVPFKRPLYEAVLTTFAPVLG